ncbi:glycosylphosphatidylinositol anchor biosynthesis [Aspergillus pseudonomiae]
MGQSNYWRIDTCLGGMKLTGADCILLQEWRHHLRSSIHPLLFATVYSIADLGARVLRLSPAFRADLLIVAPKVAQAVLSAIGDLYTWKLARYVYGRRSHEAWAAEVRFIYPLLPSLHVLTAPPLVDFFLPAVSHSNEAYMPRRLSLVFLLLVNVTIAIYTSVYHASGAINVLSYLRDQQQAHTTVDNSPYSPGASQRITAGFLMPCHSTPWRSHLVDPNIHAWALSCEPPVDLNEAQKAVYVDEADQFYNDPSQFLRNNMVGGLRHLPRKPSYLASSKPRETNPQAYQQATPHEWPDYLIFFAPLEPTLHSLLRSSSYGECWRTWNTAWHDDSRRRGDIIVWCLDPTEQAAWRSATRKRTFEHRDRQFDRIVETFRKNAPGQRKSSPWTRWTSSLSGQSASSSWSWPWEQRRRTWLGIQLPVWKKSSWNLPSWTWPKSSKKKTRAVDRDLWS